MYARARSPAAGARTVGPAVLGRPGRAASESLGREGEREKERQGASEGLGPGCAPARPLGRARAGPGSEPGQDGAVSCRPRRPE